jgi:Leucine-rich repeat (LRR) protein
MNKFAKQIFECKGGSIDLSNEEITDSDCKEIAKALKVNQTLRELNLSANDIKGAGAVALGEAIMENTTLKTLIINGEIPVSQLRGDDEKCTELDLNNKGYEDADAIIIASLLKVNQTLRELDLMENDIQDVGAVALGEALQQNRSLQWIYGVSLSDVETGFLRRNRGIQATKYIKECKEAELDLSHVSLENEGIAELCLELQLNRTLTVRLVLNLEGVDCDKHLNPVVLPRFALNLYFPTGVSELISSYDDTARSIIPFSELNHLVCQSKNSSKKRKRGQEDEEKS